MQGKDTLNLIPLEDLSSAQIESLTLLYQSIAQERIVQFFLTLFFLSRQTTTLTCGELAVRLNVGIDELDEMRKECEALNLIKTFYNLKSYTLNLKEPLKPFAFLQHELFGRYFYQRNGADCFYEMLDHYGINTEIDPSAKNISASFDIRVFNSWDESSEKEYLSSKSFQPKDEQSFFIQTFIHHLSPLVFPLELRTPEVLTQIEKYGNLYHVSYEKMRTYLGKAIDYQNLLFDHKKLERLIRQMPITVDENIEDIYQLSPFEFLQQKQPNIPIPLADKRLIEKLLSEYNMRKEVVNILLENAMNKNNQTLNSYYIEQEAAVWIRRGVKSKEDALLQVNDSKKTTRTSTTKSKTKLAPQPVYTESVEDEEEINKLRELLKKGE